MPIAMLITHSYVKMPYTAVDANLPLLQNDRY